MSVYNKPFGMTLMCELTLNVKIHASVLTKPPHLEEEVTSKRS